MNENDSLTFAGFIILFLILTSICGCCDKVINRTTFLNNNYDDNDNNSNLNGNLNEEIPPKYEEIYDF